MQQQNINNQIEHLLKQLNDEQAGALPQDDQSTDEEPEEIIDVYFVRREPEITVVDATPQTQKSLPSLFTAITLLFCLMLPISTIFLQGYLALNPPLATVTIIPETKQITFNGTLHIGRLVQPITLSQTRTAPATGTGHQDAKQATGLITFYNGQLQSITVPAGTMLAGADGVQVVTDQDASVPSADLTANPPVIGNTTVSAHALTPGASGNIQALDINKQCCSSVVAKNLSNFSGGQDERTFKTVTKADIANAMIALQTALSHSMKDALQGQLEAGEALIPLPCTPTTASDHQEGDEATQVTVTVFATCSAAAYNREELQAQAAQRTASQALRKLGAGYSLLGAIQVTPTSAAVDPHQKQLVFSLNAHGTFAHTFTAKEQEYLKQLIHGKTKQQAVQLLAALPGIASASIHWHGFTDESSIPKDPRNIHIVVILSLFQSYRSAFFLLSSTGEVRG